MAVVKLLRGGQITLPVEARRALRLGEGDLLEAEVLDGEMRLRPVAAVGRPRAWKRVVEIVDEDKWIGPGPRPSPEEEERWITDALAEDEPDRLPAARAQGPIRDSFGHKATRHEGERVIRNELSPEEHE